MRGFIGSGIAFVVLMQASAAALAAWPRCPVAHCSDLARRTTETCRQTGSAGSLVFVEHPAGSAQFCYCSCSCVAADTTVQTGPTVFKRMGQIGVDDSILALRSDGTWSPSRVGFSDGTSQPNDSLAYAIFVATANGASLITSPDHVYMLGDRSFKRADRLLPGDKLMDARTLEPTDIVRLHAGSYFGPVHTVVAGEWDEKDTIDGHLINTSGVISADYLAQINLDLDTTALQVGSDEYQEKYADELRALNGAPEDLQSFTYQSGTTGTPKKSDALGALVLDEKKGWMFETYTLLDIPEDAYDFLPRGDRVAKPGLLSPLDYTTPDAVAKAAVSRMRPYYPNVEFRAKWHSNEVNAKAYLDKQGRPVVLLMGGFVRHSAVHAEAIDIILGHELGHHYAGPPRFPDQWKPSCEGQSDYWGANVPMRQVWPGPEALLRTQRGAQQLYQLFANGLMNGNLLDRDRFLVPAAGGCGHPPPQCRVDTYLAASRLDPKPRCAE